MYFLRSEFVTFSPVGIQPGYVKGSPVMEEIMKFKYLLVAMTHNETLHEMD